MSDIEEQTAYFLERANQETERANRAAGGQAAAAHRELAMRYSIRALQLRLGAMDVELSA